MVTPEQLDDFREAAEAVLEFADGMWLISDPPRGKNDSLLAGAYWRGWGEWSNLEDKWGAANPECCIKAISEAVPASTDVVRIDADALPDAVFPTATHAIEWIYSRIETTFEDIREGYGYTAQFTEGVNRRHIRWPFQKLRVALFQEWKHARQYAVTKAAESDVRGIDYVRDLATETHLLCLRVEGCIGDGVFAERHEPLENLEANREKACQELAKLRLEAHELHEKWSHPAVEKVLREIERAVAPALPLVNVGYQSFTTLFAAVSSWCTSFVFDLNLGAFDELRAGRTPFTALRLPIDLAMVADFEIRLAQEWAIASGTQPPKSPDHLSDKQSRKTPREPVQEWSAQLSPSVWQSDELLGISPSEWQNRLNSGEYERGPGGSTKKVSLLISKLPEHLWKNEMVLTGKRSPTNSHTNAH